MADRLHRGAGRGAKWRYTLPETENISTARSSPLVFRSSTPKHDDESNQTSGLDKNNDTIWREEAKTIKWFRFDPEKGQREEKDKVGMVRWQGRRDAQVCARVQIDLLLSTYRLWSWSPVTVHRSETMYDEFVSWWLWNAKPYRNGNKHFDACFRFSTIMAWFSLKSSSSNNSPFYMSRSSECFIVFHSRV